MRSGKLDPLLLESLLSAPPLGPDVALGPGPGRDAAAVRLPDRYLVLASDPISFGSAVGAAGAGAGASVVDVNANDVACLGADPRWFLATILLPPAVAEPDIAPVFDGIRAACERVGAALVGGHTEVSDAVTRPVIAGTMIGDAPLDRFYPSTAVRPGDDLVQIGPVAIEGTALLAAEAAPALRAGGLSDTEIRAAAALWRDPGISVVDAARACWGAAGLHSLHDPTEGGVATACLEMALAGSGGDTHLTVEVDEGALLTHPLALRVSAALGIDWRGLLASGALLAAVAADQSDAILARLQAARRPAARIGRFHARPGPQGEPAILRSPEGSRALPRFARDEALRVLGPEG